LSRFLAEVHLKGDLKAKALVDTGIEASTEKEQDTWHHTGGCAG